MAKEIHQLTLTFRDPYLEETYLVQKLKYDTFLLGLISIIGLLFNISYSIYEFSTSDPVVPMLKWLRLFYLTPLCVAILVVTRRESARYNRATIAFLSLIFFLSAIAYVLLLAIMSPHPDVAFFNRVLLLLFSCALFSGLRFKWQSFFLPIVVIAIIILSLQVMTFPSSLKVAMLIQLPTGLFVALGGSYLHEFLHRENFISNKKIELSRKRLLDKTNAIEEENLFKDTLLSIVAHDFRGPLARLKGTIDLADKNYITPDELDLYLKKLSGEFDTVNLMSERILNWIKSQTKGSRIKPEPFDFNKVIESNFQLYAAQAADKSLVLSNEVPDEFSVVSDLNIVNTVIRNLISNAIKFNKKDGCVIVSATSDNDSHIIACSNTGSGFNEDLVNKNNSSFLFTRGSQNEIGFGMGIKMCNDLLKYLDSKLIIQVGENNMTIVSFRLPTPHNGVQPVSKSSLMR